MGRGMSKFLVRESSDVECDGVAGAVAAREETLAANRAAERDSAQRARHVAERHCVNLAFDPPLPACLALLRAMRERTFEHRNSGGGVSKVCTVRKRCGKR